VFTKPTLLIRQGMRGIVSMALVLAFVSSSISLSYAAGTTGNVSGHVYSAAGRPLAGVRVVASSPTAKNQAFSDASGFYSLTGLPPDTYLVSFELTGYNPTTVYGVTITPDQTITENATLRSALKEIGRVTSRSSGSAFQPGQTVNTYTVTPNQITTIEGRENFDSELQLVASLPGASLDSSGYPVLRGGRENEEGYQFEGITYNDPATNQFVNSLTVNGINSFQLIPGAGNASQGNAGTGTLNYTAKRGTRPPFGQVEVEAQNPIAGRQLRLEYGFATPNNRFSEYVSFYGNFNGNQIGPAGTKAADIGQYLGGTNDVEGRDLVSNLVYKFGKNNEQALQFLYQNQAVRFGLNYGGLNGLFNVSGDPIALSPTVGIGQGIGLTKLDIQTIVGLHPGQAGPNAPLAQNSIIQPNETFKLEYSNNINAKTYLTARYYRVNALAVFDEPLTATPAFGAINDALISQGGTRTGLGADLTEQFNSRNLAQFGLRYEFAHAVGVQNEPDFGTQILAGAGGAGGAFLAADFLPFSFNTNPDSACSNPNFGASPTVPACGYLSQFFPNGIPRIPSYYRAARVDRSTLAYYANDTYSPTDRLKFDLGIRVDTAHSLGYPGVVAPNGQSTLNPDTVTPEVIEPRVAANFQLNPRNAIRVSYGRSVQFGPLLQNNRVIIRSVFDSFNNVPVNPADPLTGADITSICGRDYRQMCGSYADQLYSLYQRRAGVPFQPTLPETFSNWDATYSHDFGHNIGMRVTPFYRRGFDAIVRTRDVIGFRQPGNAPILGPTLATNKGVDSATGVEFYITKDAPVGLSGTLSMTYQNVFSNVIPGSASEDFFPTVPTASLALGNLYRVGYLSPFVGTLALQYKTRAGWRLSPQITYDRGYPLGTGTQTAVFINNRAVNIPNTDYTGNSLAGVSYCQYTDPLNPGSVFNPNISATCGTAERANAGGILSRARFSTSVTLEYAPPKKRYTAGVTINNLFNQTFAEPALNGASQIVSTGVFGPQSPAVNQLYLPYLGLGSGQSIAATPDYARPYSPYNIVHNASPRQFTFYYSLKL